MIGSSMANVLPEAMVGASTAIPGRVRVAAVDSSVGRAEIRMARLVSSARTHVRLATRLLVSKVNSRYGAASRSTACLASSSAFAGVISGMGGKTVPQGS